MSRINVIGAACIDILVENVDKTKFFSGKYKADTIRTSFGGDALNEALVLNHFGSDVKLVSVLGNDPYGKTIKDHLDEKGIAYDEDIIRDDIDTYVSIVLIDENGERSFVGSKNGSVRVFDLEHINIDDDCQIVSFASLFISQKLNEEKLNILFKKIKDQGKILCVDCSTPKNNETINDLSYLKYVDYFFCNESEAKALSGKDDPSLMMECLEKTGAKNIIIKCGDKGCYYDGRYHHYFYNKNVIDTTGAGDSFVAGFILALADGMDIEGCLKKADLFGSEACTEIGATAWLDKVEKEFHLI